MLALDLGDKIRGDASAANVVDYTLHGLVGIVITQLADGQLPAAIGDLYTAGGAGIAITSIVLVNTDASPRTINLYLTPSGGTARRLIPKDLSLGVGACLVFDGQKVSVLASSGQLLFSWATGETLLAGGLPAALDGLSLKVKEQSPISGFATSAKQDTMITALQLIDDLRAALGSVNTDDLQVDVKTMPTVTVQAAGGDKIFAIESAVGETIENTDLVAGDNTVSFSSVPTGKLWVITHFAFTYNGTSPPVVRLGGSTPSVWFVVNQWNTPTAGVWNGYPCKLYLPAASVIRFYITGATLHDVFYASIFGYQMDAP